MKTGIHGGSGLQGNGTAAGGTGGWRLAHDDCGLVRLAVGGGRSRGGGCGGRWMREGIIHGSRGGRWEGVEVRSHGCKMKCQRRAQDLLLIRKSRWDIPNRRSERRARRARRARLGVAGMDGWMGCWWWFGRMMQPTSLATCRQAGRSAARQGR